MKEFESHFCMKQFKPLVAVLAVLVVLVLGWTGWHCSRKAERNVGVMFAAAATPPAPPISVKAKMLHPYWGNCNKCHVTLGAGKPVSKVMAGPAISIKDKMLHKYWGNCLLCHQVTDGLKPRQRAKAAALNRFTAQTLGLKTQTVTVAMMQKLGLANEDGVLVLEIAAGSTAALAGLRQGDEIIRVGKIRVETVNDFQAALNKSKPGSNVKIKIYRGNKQRNMFVRLPKNLNVTPAAMTQNQIETLAEQLGVPKTQHDVARALQRQRRGQTAANLNYGKVAVATMGPGLGYQVSYQFGASPYFVVFDPAQNGYRVVANPNANDATGRGIQTGQYIVDLGVSNVVAGGFDQTALHTLRDLRVNVYSGVTGSAQSALAAYMAGQFSPANLTPNMQLAMPRAYSPPAAATQQAQVIY